jgi:hypothetical protein
MEYSTWKSSAHGRAFTNHIFAHAVARDRQAWCLNCHTPLWSGETREVERIIGYLGNASGQEESMPWQLDQGINCATCHIRDGHIIGSGRKARDATGAKHEVKIDANLRSEKFCAGCHQFNFPAEVHPTIVYQSSPAMQNVVEEHLSLRKLESDKRCADCHYRHADHSLHQLTYTDMREKFSVRVWRIPGGIEYRIETPPIGHHFPTGDLFRVMRLTIFDAQGNELLRKDFRKEVRVVDQALVSDTTLRPIKVGESAQATRRVALAGQAVSCTLTYHLQGNIEPTLAKEGSLKPFIRELAPCEIH